MTDIKTMKTELVELGHVYHRCHDVPEWDSDPKDGLDYQGDYPNEDYYSIYTNEELDTVLNEVKLTGKLQVEHLFHVDDSCKDWLGEYFGNEIHDEFDDLVNVAYLHYEHFSNPFIAKELCTRVLEMLSIEDIVAEQACLFSIDDCDIEEYYGAFRNYLLNLQKDIDIEKFRDGLEERLSVKSNNCIIKI